MNQIDPVANTDSRAFGGLDRLYGTGALDRLSRAHVAVIGIGGVGSWAAEALARSGVGRVALVDFDHIAESNLNRQIHALQSTLGQAKIDAMAQRIAAINSACRVDLIEQFATPDNLDALFRDSPHILIDACDGVRAKTAIVHWCRGHGLGLVSCGAAGGKTDAAKIRCDDLAFTQYDPLLAKVRANLRKLHNYPRDAKKRFGVDAVYSTEAIRKPSGGMTCAAEPGSALNCHGYGSIVTVTATFGMIAAGRAIHIALERAASV